MSTIPLVEVKKHKKPKNAWIVIHNDVYNVSRFLKEHPGGEEAILNVAGCDATQAFEDVGHSEDARRMLKEYKIGSLSPEESIPHVDPCCKAVLTKKPSCGCFFGFGQSKNEQKTWKTYDGSSKRRSTSPKKEKSPTPSTRSPPRVIIVPRQRRPRGYPCDKSRWWLWALLALGVAAAGAFAYKKYSG